MQFSGVHSVLNLQQLLLTPAVVVQSHFSKWIEAEVEPEDLEDLYKEVSTHSLQLQGSLCQHFCLECIQLLQHHLP